MLNVLGGLGKLAGSLGLPVSGEKGGEQSVSAGSGPGDSRSAGLHMAADTDATLQGGRSSGISLESAVTLEGIASTLNRIYTAQVA
jgi:hypothetical protein